MINHTSKQLEWDEHASKEQDSGKQILRTFTDSQWMMLADEVSQKLELDIPDISILDVGCGNAHLISLFQDRVASISGVDYANTMISQAKKKIPKGEFRVSSADALPFDDRVFDRTLCYSIFHYFLSDKQVFDTIDELCRVSKEGGVILIGDLLDARFEQEIKSKSNLNIEAKLPKIQRYSEWRFVDFDTVSQYLYNKGYRFEILSQNEAFATSNYRKDLKIWV